MQDTHAHEVQFICTSVLTAYLIWRACSAGMLSEYTVCQTCKLSVDVHIEFALGDLNSGQTPMYLF